MQAAPPEGEVPVRINPVSGDPDMLLKRFVLGPIKPLVAALGVTLLVGSLSVHEPVHADGAANENG